MSSHLTFENVIPRLFETIPALRFIYEAELDYMLDEPPLAYVVFGDILIPALETALGDENDELAESIGSFLEDAARGSNSDPALANLLAVEVGEWLMGTTWEARAAVFLGPETKRICRYIPGLATQRLQLRSERETRSLKNPIRSMLKRGQRHTLR
jgi:hypothetical protein